MVMRSWVLKSWPEVDWQPPPNLALGPLFQHMGTDVRPEVDEFGRAIGETVWAACVGDDQVIGAAWEWVEILPGVPAIRDPNGFVTNARLVDDYGAELQELQTIVSMNRIAHATPWQNAVVQAIHGGGVDDAEQRRSARAMRRRWLGDAHEARVEALMATFARRGAPAFRHSAAAGL
jgi:hypothetical protein